MPRNNVIKTRPMIVIEHRIGESLEAFLYRRYHVDGATQPEIAEELNVNTATVSRWMSQLGVEARFPGQRKFVA